MSIYIAQYIFPLHLSRDEIHAALFGPALESVLLLTKKQERTSLP